MFPSSFNQPLRHNNSNPPPQTGQPPPPVTFTLRPPTYQQPPIPLSAFENPSVYVVQQQSLGPLPHTPHRGEGGLPIQHSHSSLNSTGLQASPVYQGVTRQYQQRYQPPGPGPSYNQHTRGRHRTEVQYTTNHRYVSSRMVSRDHYTSTHPANAQMGAFNNTTGRACRPPPKNPMMANNARTQRVRLKPYERDRATRKEDATREERTDKVHLSMYEVPITGLQSKLIDLVIHPLSIFFIENYVQETRRNVVQTSPRQHRQLQGLHRTGKNVRVI